MRKLPLYLREGVRHVWLLDPDARFLDVFRAGPDGWILVGSHVGDAIVRAEPFDAVPLDLLPLWGETRTAPPPG